MKIKKVELKKGKIKEVKKEVEKKEIKEVKKIKKYTSNNFPETGSIVFGNSKAFKIVKKSIQLNEKDYNSLSDEIKKGLKEI